MIVFGVKCEVMLIGVKGFMCVLLYEEYPY